MIHSHIKNHARSLVAMLVGGLIICAALLFPSEKPLQALGALKPFGGSIAFVRYCCNGIVLTLTGPRGINWGDYFIDYVSVANPMVNYLNQQVFYGGGQSTVGVATYGGAACIDIEAECESATYVSGGAILKIGTSMPGL